MKTDLTTTRRDFMKTASAAVLGASFTPLKLAGADAVPAEAAKILNFNPDMEYRRCGKTGWMVSAIAMGGHWKRINQIIGGEPIDAYSGNVERPDFARNRCDVVTRLIERVS